MINKISFILCFVAILCIHEISSQNQNIGLLCKVSNEQTKLKIIPTDAYHWLKGIDNGYVISRRELGTDADFKNILEGAIMPMSKNQWPQDDKGIEMYAFHEKSVSKIRSMMINPGSFLQAFKQLQRADENFKMYMFITMRDELFGDFTGLEIIDDSAIFGKSYEYKVSLNNTNEVSDPIFSNVRNETITPHVFAIQKDKAIRLSWIHDENSPIIAYYLEKSATGMHYESITNGPLLPHNYKPEDTLRTNDVFEQRFLDSLSENYQTYFYRLIALDAWGDRWQASESIQAMGIDLTPPKIEKFTVGVDSINRTFIIDWEPSNDADIESYFITKSHHLKGLDTVIIQDISPNNKTTYIFEDPLELKNYFFKIGAIDTAGNYGLSEMKSVFINDITPPRKIDKILYEVDSTGIVSLDWSPMSDTNPNGYIVYKSFAKDDNFIRITDTLIYENSFIDTNSISLLNHIAYYYISGVDKSFNLSQPSEVLEVILPDTIPPSTTYISEINQQDERITIRWDENQSEDVLSYLIYKKTIEKNWALLSEVQAGNTVYTYDELSTGRFQYKIIAKDESGNTASTVSIYVFEAIDMLDEEFFILVEREEPYINLKWKNLGVRYKLYKSVEDEFVLVDYLSENNYSIPVENVLTDTSFYVKAFDDKGRLILSSKTTKL